MVDAVDKDYKTTVKESLQYLKNIYKMKQKLLIINKDAFGYHVDTYKYCQYLRKKYDITYICIEPKEEKIESLDGVKVIYTTNKPPLKLRAAIYIVYCTFFALFYKGKIFVKFFLRSDFIKRMLFWKKMILDIRTLGIVPIEEKRREFDARLIKTCNYYDHISIISEGVRDKMHIDNSKTSILPLGADVISNINKNFDQINLLYVGTLNGRRIDDTIKGYKLFSEKYPDNKFTYDIIGNGNNNELEKISELIGDFKLSDRICLHGFIPNNKLKPFFDKCNVGVSYIPMTEYYDHQPPTKTYEYILSGLFTIATSTHCNKEVINSINGVLIEDNPESFSQALKYIYLNRNFDSNNIRNTLLEHTWKRIVNNKLIPILEKI
ncbi:MAG TPA: hypothetical protein DC024_02480 [Clostridiales bacterium]|nr:hypothetical protein [Clostridiales bacterium]